MVTKKVWLSVFFTMCYFVLSSSSKWQIFGWSFFVYTVEVKGQQKGLVTSILQKKCILCLAVVGVNKEF